MKDHLIHSLNLTPHIEGGYFRRTYQSALQSNNRRLMTSIFYMLTSDRPIGYFHRNKSDIMHYFHLGSPLEYLTISPEGQLERFIVGSDVAKGQQLQLLVKGGYWKASVLKEGEFGLISEAVAPGFDYEDMSIAKAADFQAQFSHLWEQVKEFVAK